MIVVEQHPACEICIAKRTEQVCSFNSKTRCSYWDLDPFSRKHMLELARARHE